ncbi:hypothetical protein CROQUDRAFT_36914 [Cronartium quercuum f. sp. fusiforme G11]|uniref:Uncharacterized protein n=1 Tax=Cronartium quercuum f. sp. fusiforme G11 TaxID=708437 RepID=A0A9P6NQ55_9BASI|nr:hypothetical protein CROQUDRAFT_36914 [Cronartium quercuum f. sp. fusiforme G11]
MDPLLEEDETGQTSSLERKSPNALTFGKASREAQPEKLPPPLPSLKSGDETVSGRDEPLVDEIACALREWYTLLFVHLNKRQYKLFHIMKEHIEALHMGRRQLLAQTLSTEEAAKLRRDLVNRLVYGNLAQDLDIIVRHPDYGALVDAEVDFESVDSRSWMSTIRMYVCQVKLAYLSQTLSLDRGFGTGPLNLPDPLAHNTLSSMSINSQSKLSEPNQFYHVMLEVKSFLACPCTAGETVELYFSLYNKSEARFLTEEFCVILNHLGVPIRSKSKLPLLDRSVTGHPGEDSSPKFSSSSSFVSVRTMFKDLSQHDVQDSIFLVCRLVKNGGMKSTPVTQPPLSSASLSDNNSVTQNALSPGPYEGDSSSARGSFDEVATPGPEAAGVATQQFAHPDSNGEYSGMTFMQPKLGGQSIRRPFGCAVVEISAFAPQHSNGNHGGLGSNIGYSKPSGSGVLESPITTYNMNIFSPVNEASFPTLHEDIIASRVKEFFGSGNLAGSGFHGSSSLKSPGSNPNAVKNESIAIELRTFYGDTTSIVKDNNARLSEVPLTSRLGFPDVVFPDDSRNEIYVKLWSGDFSHFNPGTSKMISTSGKNIEVAAELRTKTGQVLERVISRGSGEPKVTRYNSMVYKNNHTPTWGELMKLDISADMIEDCHLFFTFRNRQDKTNRSNTAGNIDKPFAFAFLPLFSTNKTFIPDGEHNLALFRYDKQSATPEVYMRVQSTLETGQGAPEITSALSKLLIPLKDAFTVRSFLCSTRHTQNEVLLKLIKWEALLDHPQDLRETLTKLKFASEVEICKFLRNIFDALFGVLVSRVNGDSKEYDDLVFNALVTLLGIVSDRRFTNFKPVVDLYIDQHFSCTTASTHLIRSLQNLLLNPTSPQNAQPLRSSIKVWGYLLRFIIRSRELQRPKDFSGPGGLISDVIDTKFKADIGSVLNRITGLMLLNSSSVIGTQTLAVQHFASLLPELAKVCGPHELLEKANGFVESISATKGKIVIWKLLLQEHIIMSEIFDLPECRVQLVPKLTTWVKPHLGEFEEYAMFKTKDSESTKDSARVSWLEGIRISTSLIAVALDKLHEALIDPNINQDRTALAQEEDNVEYLLSLLPKLLDSFIELENPTNIEAVQRLGTTASVISPVPIVFPATYPFSLLNSLPADQALAPAASISTPHSPNPMQVTTPSMQNSLGEIAVVMVTMILLSPDRLLSSFLEMLLEVEGKTNFASFLSKLFKVFHSILKNKAFPSNWLNINILTHKIALKLIQIVAPVMEQEFIPKRITTSNEDDPNSSFNSELWSDFFVLVHGLLSSQHLVIEEFPPQKRRAVWKLAGDIRGEGSKLLKRCWEAIGSQELPAGPDGTTMTRCGGYQIQFIPGFVEPLLELCLSHHDEMRANAVTILYSVIITEFQLNQEFTVVADEIIDKLDNLLGNSSSVQNDEMSRSFFVGQLQSLFESESIDVQLRKQVEAFLESLNQFLDLLLSIRNLPPGDEFIDDRVIGTLKLMSFIRNIGRSGIYIHYVHKLVNFHATCGNFVEAGLAMRLHSDLHEWDLHAVVEAMPELSLPKQTVFRRKEVAWESGIQICKELQEQYEHVSFDYERLSEVLAHQSSLYHNIVKSDRYFSEYFRVAFYGLGFPPSVQNRQFVYRGYEWEKYAEFCDRMNNKHPNAQILRTNVVSTDELQFAEGQYLHITKVQAEPDRTSIIFTNLEVPNAVRQYYEHNATNTFSYSRPFSKDEEPNTDPVMLWIEKTFLVCEDAFPTVLQRSEVLEIRLLEISPIENAILNTDQKTRELDTLQRRYLALSKTGSQKLNTNPLSMALNSAVDAFLRPEYLAKHPDQQEAMNLLRQAIENQTAVIDAGLKLHRTLCPPEMKTFHATLYNCKVFCSNFSTV